MITFNGKPMCDNCSEQPMIHHYDGWELCNDCLLSYSRHVKALEDMTYDEYLDDLAEAERLKLNWV